MSTRPILFAFGILAVAIAGGCKNKYNDVYSFKKNSFVAPVVKRDIAAPPPVDPLQGTQPGTTAPGMPGEIPGIPGVPGAPDPTAPPPAPTGIPGLDPAPPPAPTPAPIPGT
jgi:hypothetical protein